MKFKKGDQVKIISGNDRGRTGKVIAAMPHAGTMVVEGINKKKKHVRPKKQGQRGEMIEFPAPFPAPRAMLVCGQCGKPTRAVSRREEGKKIRVCRKCGGVL